MKYENVCPNCGSAQIEYASLMRGATKTITGLGIPEMYYCPECGYEGSVILEIDQKHIKQAPFKYAKPTYSKPDKHSIEILTPVFTIVIMVFIFTTALGFLQPIETKYYTETFEPLPANYLNNKEVQQIEIVEMPRFNSPVIVNELPSGEVILEVKERTPPELDVKLGTESVSGFFWPLFMIIFVAGFIGLMIAKHYERSLKFI